MLRNGSDFSGHDIQDPGTRRNGIEACKMFYTRCLPPPAHANGRELRAFHILAGDYGSARRHCMGELALLLPLHALFRIALPFHAGAIILTHILDTLLMPASAKCAR